VFPGGAAATSLYREGDLDAFDEMKDEFNLRPRGRSGEVCPPDPPDNGDRRGVRATSSPAIVVTSTCSWTNELRTGEALVWDR
jgi:hypothetical protein